MKKQNTIFSLTPIPVLKPLRLVTTLALAKPLVQGAHRFTCKDTAFKNAAPNLSINTLSQKEIKQKKEPTREKKKPQKKLITMGLVNIDPNFSTKSTTTKKGSPESTTRPKPYIENNERDLSISLKKKPKDSKNTDSISSTFAKASKAASRRRQGVPKAASPKRTDFRKALEKAMSKEKESPKEFSKKMQKSQNYESKSKIFRGNFQEKQITKNDGSVKGTTPINAAPKNAHRKVLGHAFPKAPRRNDFRPWGQVPRLGALGKRTPLSNQIKKKDPLKKSKFSQFKKEKQKLIRARKVFFDCVFSYFKDELKEDKTQSSGGQLLPLQNASLLRNAKAWRLILLKKLFFRKILHKYGQLKTNKRLSCNRYFKLLKPYKKTFLQFDNSVRLGTTLALAERLLKAPRFPEAPKRGASGKRTGKSCTPYAAYGVKSLSTFDFSKIPEAASLKLSRAKAHRNLYSLKALPFSEVVPAKLLQTVIYLIISQEKVFFNLLSDKERAILYLSLAEKQKKWKRARARKLRKQIKQIKKRIRKKIPRVFPIPKKYRKHYLAAKKRFPNEQPFKVKKLIQLPKRLSNPLPIIFIQASINNTFLTLTDTKGNTLYATSAGKVGLKNARKSGRLVSQSVALDLGRKCRFLRVRQVDIRMRGMGQAKRTALTALRRIGLRVRYLTSYFEHPFNGCRSPKKRRV